MINWLQALLWPVSPPTIPEKVKKSLEERADFLSNTTGRYRTVQSILSRIEAKSGTLLTHVSLMVALTAVFWGVKLTENSSLDMLPEWFFGAHFIGYLVIALMCIRCQFHMDQGHFLKLPKRNMKNFFPDPKESGLKGIRIKQEGPELLENQYYAEIYYRERIFRIAFMMLYVVTLEFILSFLLVMTIFNANGELTEGLTGS